MTEQGEVVRDKATAWRGLVWGRRTVPLLRKGTQELGPVGEMTCPRTRNGCWSSHPPVLVPGCHVGAVLDEEPGYIHMTPFGRPMQRGRRPFLALGCRVGTVLDEEPGHIDMTPEGRLMQRRTSVRDEPAL